MNLQEFRIAVQAGQITTPSFVSIRNYRNKQGEVSNYLINCGTNYQNAKEADLAFLEFVNTDAFEFPESAIAVKDEALSELAESMRRNISENPEEHTMRSRVNDDVYDSVCPNVKVHNENETLYLTGMLIRKTIVEEGTYPQKNSRSLTIAKDVIRKELSTTKYRQFFLSGITNIRINGTTLEVEI